MEFLKQVWINIFGPIWLKEYWFGGWKKFSDKQLAAIAELKDPAELKRAALEAPEWEVRAAAIKKIDDPAALWIAATNDWHGDVREAAIEKLFGSEISKAIDLEKWKYEANVRINSVGRIDDQEVLIAAVMNDRHGDVREAAVKKITDPEVLKIVALNDEEEYVRRAAVEKIDDPEILKMVLLNDEDEFVRIAAAKQIADPETIKIIMAKNGAEIRNSVNGIKDPSQLHVLALCARSWDVRKAAIDRLDDSELIRFIEPLIASLKRASYEEQISICNWLRIIYRRTQCSVVKSKIRSLNFEEHDDFHCHDDDWGGGSYGPPPYHEDFPGRHSDSHGCHIDLTDL